MVNKLSSSIFILAGMILMGLGLLPIMRFAIGIDSAIAMPLFTVCMLNIAGLMAGLSGMILLARRQSSYLSVPTSSAQNDNRKMAVLIHASGLLLYSGIPLANFLACFFLWEKQRQNSSALDAHGVNALNFQITIYLYLLLSLFLVFIFIGLFSTLLIVLFHFLCTVIACLQASRGKIFSYPANINIVKPMNATLD